MEQYKKFKQIVPSKAEENKFLKNLKKKWL